MQWSKEEKPVIRQFLRKKRQTVEGARKEQCFNMQITSFIRCAIILIVSYSSSSHQFICNALENIHLSGVIEFVTHLALQEGTFK